MPDFSVTPSPLSALPAELNDVDRTFIRRHYEQHARATPPQSVFVLLGRSRYGKPDLRLVSLQTTEDRIRRAFSNWNSEQKDLAVYRIDAEPVAAPRVYTNAELVAMTRTQLRTVYKSITGSTPSTGLSKLDLADLVLKCQPVAAA